MSYQKENNQIKRAIIEIIHSCNNNCIYCYQSPQQRQSDVRQEKVDVIKRKIIELRELGVKYLEFSGGEPTVSPYLSEYISLAKKEGFERISLLTNGRRLAYKKYLAQLIEAGVNTVIFSIPAMTADLYSVITGTEEKAFLQLIDALHNVQLCSDIEVGATIVIHKNNYTNLVEIVKKLQKYKLHFISLGYMLPYADNWFLDMQERFMQCIPTYWEVYPYISKVLGHYGSKMKICIDGIPFCFLKGFERFVLNEIFKEDSYVVNPLGELQRRLEIIKIISVKKDRCIICNYTDQCVGFFTRYKEKYGVEVTDSSAIEQKVAIDIQSGPCQYKCGFCSRHKEGVPYYFLNGPDDLAQVNIPKLEQFLQTSVAVSKHLDIFGRERVDEFEGLSTILLKARNSGFEHITLWTSGLRLGCLNKTEQLIKKGITQFEIPIYGYTAEVHDRITGIKGSFWRLVKGLQKARSRFNINISFHTVVIKQNYRSLPQLIEFMANEFNDTSLSLWGYYPDTRFNYKEVDVYWENSIPFSEVVNVFSRIKVPSKTLAVRTAFFPFCIVWQLKASIANLQPIPVGPMRLLAISNKGTEYRFLSGREEFASFYPKQCRKCKKKFVCTGIFRAYKEIYGDKEFKPMT